MNFSKGYNVKNFNQIFEGYELKDNIATANISNEKLKTVIIEFINKLTEPCFFILELPVTRNQELQLSKKEFTKFHSNVYYIDGLSKSHLFEIMEKYDDLLINDGLCEFGFASHVTRDEIFVCKYNVVKIFSNAINVENFFANLNIKKFDKLLTAWEFFSKDCYGDSYLVETNGLTVYDLPNKLSYYGIYLAEIR